MWYQNTLEAAFLDELEKIAAAEKVAPGLWSKLTEAWRKGGLSGVGKVQAGNAAMSTWGRRALIGAVPGAVIGAGTAEPGRGVSGAITGGVLGAGAGLAGGALAQSRALGKIKGWKSGMSAAQFKKFMARPGVKRQYQAATTHAFPGILSGVEQAATK